MNKALELPDEQYVNVTAISQGTLEDNREAVSG